MNEKHTLEIDSVLLEFGTRRLLNNIWLKVETGCITGLLGRNGSGKSCLMKIMMGELSPQDQSFRIDDLPLYGSRRNPAQLLYLPQSNFLPGNLPLERAFSLFRVDYAAFLDRFPHFKELAPGTKIKLLSGGEQRIAEVYLILYAPTQFVLMDEPFSQIMPVHVETIRQLIREQARYKGILISDHYYRDVLALSDRLYLLSEGQTHSIQNPEQLRELGYLSTINQ